MRRLITWFKSHKKAIGAAAGTAAYVAHGSGLPEVAHVLELAAAALIGGGLRSDAGVKKDQAFEEGFQ